MKAFFYGMGIGMALGVLFAPSSGEQTRSNLTQRASDLADNAREAMDEGRERLRSGISAVRGSAERMAQESGYQSGTGTTGGSATRPTGTENL